MADDGGIGSGGTEPREVPAAPQFLPSDQLLDGSPRPSATADEPPQAGSEEADQGAAVPPWRRRRVWSAGVAAAAVLAAGGALWWVLQDDASSPQGFSSLPPPCAAVQRSTVARLAPQAGSGEPYVADRNAPGERFVQCSWNQPPARGSGGQASTRDLVVALRLYADQEDRSGVRRAREAYESAWRTALDSRGRTDGDPAEIRYRSPFPLRGLGDEAFAQPVQTRSSLGHSGKVVVTVRLRNVLVTTEYRGSTYPLDKSGFPDLGKGEPLDAPTARSGAEAMAQDVTKALASCSSCRG